MGFSGLGGGIMLLLAAGLWLVYLMPSWFKRREFIATERAEVRRQQALRVLQETTSIPVMQRVESIVTAAGEVRDREKLAEAIRRSKEAQAARVVTRTLTGAAGSSSGSSAVRVRAVRRLRRTRAMASFVLLVAVVVAFIQFALMATTGIAMGAWAVLGFAAVLGVVAVSALGRLASMARRRAGVTAAPVARRVEMTPLAVSDEVALPAEQQSWTPVPLPKPMYLSRATVRPLPDMAAVDAGAELRAAARAADHALRAAQRSPEVVPISGARASGESRAEHPAPAAQPSRFAAMGIIETEELGNTDLDEVLRRRRMVG